MLKIILWSEKYFGAILIAVLTLSISQFFQPNNVYGETNPESNSEALPFNQTVITQSSFTTKTITETEVVPQKTVYSDDPETEAGEEKVIQDGADGKTIKTFKVTMYGNEEYDRELISEQTLPAQDKKILRGTKIVWKILDTPDGEIRYWKKMRVYATHYDSHCPGCDETTATGMRQSKGVIAVDPKVIPLYTKLYIPGYGPAVAGDTGGAIKGKKVDLGFEDARTAGWYAHYIDIYFE